MHTDMRLDEELGFIERYSLTPTELYLVKIIFIACEGTDGFDYVKKYFNLPESVRGNAIDLLKSLQVKQIITKEFTVPEPGGKFAPTEVTFNKNFEKAFFRNSFEMGKELYDIYPTSTIVNGIEYKLRRVSKKYDSLEQAFFNYGKYINWNPVRHKEILNLVEAGKRSGYQFSTLDSFIVDNDWMNLEALNRDGKLTDNMRVL